MFEWKPTKPKFLKPNQIPASLVELKEMSRYVVIPSQIIASEDFFRKEKFEDEKMEWLRKGILTAISWTYSDPELYQKRFSLYVHSAGSYQNFCEYYYPYDLIGTEENLRLLWLFCGEAGGILGDWIHIHMMWAQLLLRKIYTWEQICYDASINKIGPVMVQWYNGETMSVGGNRYFGREELISVRSGYTKQRPLVIFKEE